MSIIVHLTHKNSKRCFRTSPTIAVEEEIILLRSGHVFHKSLSRSITFHTLDEVYIDLQSRLVYVECIQAVHSTTSLIITREHDASSPKRRIVNRNE